jgi:hypothetical protein
VELTASCSSWKNLASSSVIAGSGWRQKSERSVRGSLFEAVSGGRAAGRLDMRSPEGPATSDRVIWLESKKILLRIEAISEPTKYY